MKQQHAGSTPDSKEPRVSTYNTTPDSQEAMQEGQQHSTSGCCMMCQTDQKLIVRKKPGAGKNATLTCGSPRPGPC
jgi:hypothetical protein